MTAKSYALFVEDNIVIGDTTVTPGLRFDHHEMFGDNFSPSLNLSHKLTEALSVKGGIARAYKVPNLYQSNPNYLLYSRGNGCSVEQTNSGGCYLQGNADLAGNQRQQGDWPAVRPWHLAYQRHLLPQ